MATAPQRRPLAAKLLASIGIVGAAASCGGLGTFADPLAARGSLTVVRSRPHLVAMARVLQPASKVAPGDRVSRTLVLTARGTSFKRLTLKVTARGSLLLTDPAQGLRLTITRCAKSWRHGRSGYVCRGKAQIVLNAVPILGKRRLARASIKRGKKLFLLLTLALPASAGNSFEDQTSMLVYKFTAS